MTLQTMISPKPGRNGPSEDVIGYLANTAWLLDGATPPWGNVNAVTTQEFLFTINSLIYKSVSTMGEHSLGSIIYQVLVSIKDRHFSKTHYTPYSTLAMLRIRPDSEIEYFVISDSSVVINNGDNNLVITDERIKNCAKESRNLVRSLTASGISEDSNEYKIARKHLIEEEQHFMNHTDGYWVLSNETLAVENALSGVVSIVDRERFFAIGMSDGFARLSTHLEIPVQMANIPRAILQDGCSSLISRLRFDEEHFAYRRGLSSSKHDDASFYLFS